MGKAPCSASAQWTRVPQKACTILALMRLNSWPLFALCVEEAMTQLNLKFPLLFRRRDRARIPTLALSCVAALLSAPVWASVRCNIGGQDYALGEVHADHNYSASGQKGASGYVSLFRVIATDGSGTSVELKVDDLVKPGTYALAKRGTWRSVFSVDKGQRKVEEGEMTVSRFEMHDRTGRAAGSVRFVGGGMEGRCQFDVEVVGLERDRLRAAAKQ